MAKTKAELIKEAEGLGIEVDSKAKVAEIKALIEDRAKDVIPSEVEESRNKTQDEISPAGRDDSSEEEPKLAKAGKRSAKGVAETEHKQAKIEHQKHGAEESEQPEAQPKKAVKPSRSRLERRGKHFRKSAEQIEKGKHYSLEEAVALAKKTSHVKFDATVELHVNLGVDPRQADQNIRDSLVLPAGTGKTVKVVVADEALLAKLDKGTIDFDVLVATPQFMPKLGKYARVLGPRGLMPNPKSGTVTADTDKAVAEAQAGRVEYRVDSTGIVHLGVGKVSFTEAQLLKNVQTVLASIKGNKPGSLKGNYIEGVHLTTSMGPSVSVELANLG